MNSIPRHATHLIKLVAAVLSAGLMLLVAPGLAQADAKVVSRGAGFAHTLGSLSWWAGGYKTDKGLGFCLQPTRLLPKGTALNDPAPLTRFTNDQGVALTTAQLNQLAYLMWKASANAISNKTAVAYKLVSMTLAGYNHVRISNGKGGLSSTYYNFSLDDPNSTGSKIAAAHSVLDLARQLLAEARAKANNWDGTGKLALGEAPQAPGDNLAATVTLPGLGNGFPVVFSVSDPFGAVTQVTSPTVDGVAHLELAVELYGNYQVSAALGQPAAPRYPMVALTKTNTQSLMIVAAAPRNWAAQTDLDLLPPAPVIETTISSDQIMPGAKISDRVFLSQLVASEQVTYTVTGGLYWLPIGDGMSCPESAAPEWANAEQFAAISETTLGASDVTKDGTATIEVGTYQVPIEQVPVCLSYAETVTVLVDDQPIWVVEHPAGDPAQTGQVVIPPPAPEIPQSPPAQPSMLINAGGGGANSSQLAQLWLASVGASLASVGAWALFNARRGARRAS